MIVDIHCHLTDPMLLNDVEGIVSRAKKKGLVIINSNGLDIKTNRETLKLAEKFDIVKPSLGIHPLSIENLTDDQIKNELDFIKSKRDFIFAIGECGLDYSRNIDRGKQISLFKKFIELGEKIKKPLIIHSRQAEKEVLELLETSKSKKFLLHCFTGNFKLVKKIFDNGYFISIPCNIVRAKHFQDIVKNFNLNQMLTETDSPYLSPYKEKMNEPSFIVETIKKMSEIKNINKNEIEKTIFDNYNKFFLK